jgi:hypothetical protein
MPAVVIRVDAARVGNAILLHYLTSAGAVEEPESGSTHRNILIDFICTDNELHFGISGGSGDYEDEGVDNVKRNAISNASWQRWPVTELKKSDLGTSDFDGDQGKHGEDADADEMEAATEANVDQSRIWRTKGTVDSTWEPVMSTGMSARMETMQILMKRRTHCKPMMAQRRM